MTDQPLLNKVIVLTRTKEQAEESIQKLESLGAVVIPFPTIKIVPAKDYSAFDRVSKNIDNFNYLIFTSANAVKYSFERWDQLKITLPSQIKIAAVGKKTAEACGLYDIKAGILPRRYSARGLISFFESKSINGKKFFIPCSAIAKDDLEKGLSELGGIVSKVNVYDVSIPDNEELKTGFELIGRTQPNLFIFTSPSTFENFIKINSIDDPGIYFNNSSIAVIGDVTASAVEEYGLKADIVPDRFTMDDLIDSIINHYRNGKTVEL